MGTNKNQTFGTEKEKRKCLRLVRLVRLVGDEFYLKNCFSSTYLKFHSQTFQYLQDVTRRKGAQARRKFSLWGHFKVYVLKSHSNVLQDGFTSCNSLVSIFNKSLYSSFLQIFFYLQDAKDVQDVRKYPYGSVPR